MLEVNGLHKNFGDKKVIADLSFKLNKGEILGIEGESGAGKSTLARILCGTLRANSGEIFLENKPLLKSDMTYNKSLRTKILLIPQHPYSSLDPRQSIGSAICEPLLVHKIAQNRAEAEKIALELMDRLFLSAKLFSRKPHEISGGEAQRVLIARSLTLSPKVLISDEATSMLDYKSATQIMNIYADLAKAGMGILLISHDYLLIEKHANRSLEFRNHSLHNTNGDRDR